jgi:hypothetical protein
MNVYNDPHRFRAGFNQDFGQCAGNAGPDPDYVSVAEVWMCEANRSNSAAIRWRWDA